MFLFEHFRVAKNTGYHTKLMTEPDPINDRFFTNTDYKRQ